MRLQQNRIDFARYATTINVVSGDMPNFRHVRMGGNMTGIRQNKSDRRARRFFYSRQQLLVYHKPIYIPS